MRKIKVKSFNKLVKELSEIKSVEDTISFIHELNFSSVMGGITEDHAEILNNIIDNIMKDELKCN